MKVVTKIPVGPAYLCERQEEQELRLDERCETNTYGNMHVAADNAWLSVQLQQ
jgi:hypothetical protein